MDDISIADLQAHFNYDHTTGCITWKIQPSRNRKVGSVAGCLHPDGYRVLRLRYRPIMAHRAAWAIYHGEWPRHTIDHLNGVRDDNRIANLRDVTQEVNTHNQRAARKDNLSGLLGVGRHNGRWRARLRVSGKLLSLGTFDTAEAAHAAYVTAKRAMHVGNTL